MMRFSVGVLALVLVLAFPRASVASVIEVTVFAEFGVSFGPAGASFDEPFYDIFLDGIIQEGPPPSLSNFQGTVAFQTGPMISLTTDYEPNSDTIQSHYEFGPGTFTLTANWENALGAPMQGSFVAELLGLSIDLCEQQLSVGDCGDIFGDSQGTLSATFAAGVFSPALAHALHIGLTGYLSDLELKIDGVTGNPSSAHREAGSPANAETFEIDVTVPEPSVLSLLLLSSVGVTSHLRKRRKYRFAH